jgi:hypothetical protein
MPVEPFKNEKGLNGYNWRTGSSEWLLTFIENCVNGQLLLSLKHGWHFAMISFLVQCLPELPEISSHRDTFYGLVCCYKKPVSCSGPLHHGLCSGSGKNCPFFFQRLYPHFLPAAADQ